MQRTAGISRRFGAVADHGEYLFEKFPEWDEGELSILRARAVCTEALSGYAASFSLGEYLLLGNGEERSGGEKSRRPWKTASRRCWERSILTGDWRAQGASPFPSLRKKTAQSVSEKEFRDYKTLLQQIVQQDGEEHLEYVPVGESGPAHARIFTVEARLNSNVLGVGEGRSKRAAEQAAAKEALTLFGEEA